MAKQRSKIAIERFCKEDALDLAELIYDIFVEEDSKISNGQSNAQQSSTS